FGRAIDPSVTIVSPCNRIQAPSESLHPSVYCLFADCENSNNRSLISRKLSILAIRCRVMLAAARLTAIDNDLVGTCGADRRARLPPLECAPLRIRPLHRHQNTRATSIGMIPIACRRVARVAYTVYVDTERERSKLSRNG